MLQITTKTDRDQGVAIAPPRRSAGAANCAAAGITCVILLCAAWLLACRVSNLRGFIPDDSYITYVYGRNLAEGAGLRYNAVDSEPTEGFSSPLHVVLVAAALQMGWDPLAASRAFSLALLLSIPLTCGLLLARVAELPLGVAMLAAAVGNLFLFMLPETGLHLASGMDTAVFVAANAWAFTWMVWFALRQGPASVAVRLSGLTVLVLLACARPEGVFLAFGYLAAVPFAHRWPTASGARRGFWIDWGWLVALFIVAQGGYLLWKLSYFGYLLPNPYYVKSHDGVFGSSGAVLPGLASMLVFFKDRYLPFAFVGGALWLLLPRHERPARRLAVLLLPSLAVVLLYARSIHEVAYGYRYEYPQLVPLAVCAGLWLACLWRQRPWRFLLLTALGLVGAPFLDLPSIRTALASAGHPVVAATVWRDTHPYDAHARLALDLQETGFGQQASMMVGSAGLIPYISRFFAIDWSGLNNNRLSGRDALTMDEVWTYIDSFKLDLIISTFPPATPEILDRHKDPAFQTFPVQKELGPLGGPLFQSWNRERVEEMFYRQMSYIRDHYTFGSCYPFSPDWALIAYVRKDSPYAPQILRVLRHSERADWHIDLSHSYGKDLRNWGDRGEAEPAKP